ncbi:ceramide synthase 2a [Phycodurus eques]|uniref:ceramide synthase 2a n=1 Tax=Phycodurus eques TaxID=693459 RepID=UPI002ACD6A3C|nr:ceramide synthase 2a [Phycodurus eques]XP_061520159.1 ceramide synthase 2a [Phycodurus eques]XP_061520160.1 ceramide synthase 2a [Phycodurus eques]XP_061520161.1 ceramide synthase 2a [Phycodurus eques]
MLSRLSERLWADWIWFPGGFGWADMKDPNVVLPQLPDLWAFIPIAICFLVVRPIFERWIAVPLASLLGVRDKKRVSPPLNPLLEAHFCSISKQPTQSSLEKLSKQTDYSVRQVQRWFKQRRNQDRPSKIKKFQEASWRFTFYLFAFFAGLATLIDKPWFYNMTRMWDNFPKMPLLASQYWYYMIELGFYVSLLVSVASDVKRKDFKEQIVHHIATIVLIGFSWLVNYIRGGTLIMLAHDASDYLMESAKMFNYAGWKRTCNFIFVVFAVVFIITRLVIFPFCIIHATLVYPLTLYEPFFGFYFFNGLLLLLLALHVFWAALIVRMVIKFLPGNDIVEDERSDKEETESEEEDGSGERTRTLKNGHKNGHIHNGHTPLNNNRQKKY